MILAGWSAVVHLADARDAAEVGGKAINLARLIQAGFPVPDGFVVTVEAFRHARSGGIGEMLRREILDAYHRLGSPVVAVRSSATAEDLAGASMAGQYETILDVQGDEPLLEGIRRCWASLNAERVLAYLAQHAIDPASVGMAVVVQVLVPADVAGVLFTANPRTGSSAHMLIEASFGLGESVVSGRVQPDTLVLDRATGQVLSTRIGTKHSALIPGDPHEREVPEDKRRRCCLGQGDVRALWRLGQHVLEHFGTAQDIEWALAGGKVYLLQSRPVTTLADAEAYEVGLARLRKGLRRSLDEGHGGWVRHNLGETLPHPTPLTWSVIKPWMSGNGGFGSMYRTVGFEPSAEVARDGFLELIGGRIYMDLSRAPGLFLPGYPFSYDLALLRANPDASQSPPTVPTGSAAARWRASVRLAGVATRIAALAEDFDVVFERETVPTFVAWVRTEKERDLTALDGTQWLALWHERVSRVLDGFAPQSLIPSMISVWAMDRLRVFLDEHEWDEDPAMVANALAASPVLDHSVLSSQELYEVAAGELPLDAWIVRNGHRAPEEFDLAAPRWRERPQAVSAMAALLRGGARPSDAHQQRLRMAEQMEQRVAGNLTGAVHADFTKRLTMVRRYLRFRESGKHHLMLGYDLLRDLALEAGRRLEIGQDVFLLTSEELHDALLTGFAPLHVIEDRRTARAAEARMVLPRVITGAEIAALGEPVVPDGASRLSAFALGTGVATGPVRIVRSPDQAGDMASGYVLVCPSTDPSWTPLFVNAAALVLECGGTLSHGAVVAREMGLPAVVLADATALLREGEVVTVDAQRGRLFRGEVNEQTPPAADDTDIPRSLVPPPRGSPERRGAIVRNLSLLAWAIYLILVYALPPPVLYDPAMRVFDALLHWTIPAFGKPTAMALIAGALAASMMLLQCVATDSRRLREAKRRAGLLRQEAARLPLASPRRTVLLALAAPVQGRCTAASFIPLGLMLGPLFMTFPWFMERIDQRGGNPPPGSQMVIKAVVAGDARVPVRLVPDPSLIVDDGNLLKQSVPPIRQTLERLRQRWTAPSDLSGQPWEVLAAAVTTRDKLLSDLDAYLAKPMPDVEFTWTLSTPPDRDGRYAISVQAEGHEPMTLAATVGVSLPPEATIDAGDGVPVVGRWSHEASAPIRSVRIAGWKEAVQRGTFWTPFAGMGWPYDVGWLGVYLLSYIPAMLLFRWFLRLP